MCRFVESIKLKDGKFYRLKFHQERVDVTFKSYFPEEEPINIFLSLNQALIPQEGIFKCRIVYDEIVESIEFLPYTRKEIKSLKLVPTEIESTKSKPEDRTEINKAYMLRGDCDDILFVKDGLVTDSSYSNVAFFDGTNWITPRIPLLYGTNRAELLQNGQIIENDIKTSNLKSYKQICLFNAMIEFGEIILDISAVKS